MKKLMKVLRAAFLGPFCLLMGLPSSSQVLSSNFDTVRHRLDVSPRIAKLVPENDPFMSILLEIAKRGADQAEIYWFEDRPYDAWTTLSAALTTAATSVGVTVASVFHVKDIVQIPTTGETMRVTAVDTTANTITVSRSWGSTDAAAASSGDYILNLSNAMEESSNAPAVRTGQPSKKYNYVQEIRTPFSGSNKILKMALVTNEKERDRLTFQAMQYHKFSMARMALFGERQYDSTNNIWTMGGLREFLTENVYNVGAALTQTNFDKYVCEPLFKYDASPALLTSSRGIFSQINAWAGDKIETSSGEDTYGIRLRKYRSAHGDLYLAPSQVFEKGYASWGYALHMENLKWAEFTKTTLDRNIQENDLHGWKDEVWGEYSLEVRLPETHVTIKNVTV
jgi:hypothetical protein